VEIRRKVKAAAATDLQLCDIFHQLFVCALSLFKLGLQTMERALPHNRAAANILATPSDQTKTQNPLNQRNSMIQTNNHRIRMANTKTAQKTEPGVEMIEFETGSMAQVQE
jgi:hypothetical protein